MPKRWIALLAVAALLVVGAGVVWWATRPAGGNSSARPPSDAPAAGSCWSVGEATAATAYPWPAKPVTCAARHTVEVFQVARVDKVLVDRLHGASRKDAKVIQVTMEAEARRGCMASASAYLRGNWHASRVQVIADWIKPAANGYFGCGLVEAAAPASKTFVARTGTLRGALGSRGPLAAACVARDGSVQKYVSCDTPHDGEFVGTYTVTPLNAPFDGPKLQQVVTGGCTDLVGKYVGAKRDDLRGAYVGPTTSRDWLGSDQTYACYAVVKTGTTLTRTVKGIGAGALPA